MEQFWFNDINVLIESDKLLEFIPTEKMDTNAKLNSLMRMSVYLSLILTIISNKPNYFFIMIFGAVLTYTLYLNVEKPKDAVPETEEEIPEELEDILEAPKPDRELVPTVDNIFGNSNYVTNNEGKLSDPDNETYESQFNKIVEKDSFYEQEHLFVDKMSLRNFYKVPNTNDADSRKKFMEWCYKTEGKKN